MKVIGARAGNCVDETGSATIHRGIRGNGNLKLLDRVLAIKIRNAVATYDVVKVVTGGIVSVDSKAVEAVPVGVAGILASLLAGYADQSGVAVIAGVGRQHRKIGVLTPVHGQILYQRTIDDGTFGQLSGPQQGCRPDNFNCVRAGSHLQFDILQSAPSDLHLGQNLHVAKALEACRDGIGARHHRRKLIHSGMICGGRLFHACREAPQKHRGSRHYCSARVGDPSAERTGQNDILGVQGESCAENCSQEKSSCRL